MEHEKRATNHAQLVEGLKEARLWKAPETGPPPAAGQLRLPASAALCPAARAAAADPRRPFLRPLLCGVSVSVCVRQVNQMIQRAARLRVGQAQARVVNSSRAAIKANNLGALFKHLGLGPGGGGGA